MTTCADGRRWEVGTSFGVKTMHALGPWCMPCPSGHARESNEATTLLTPSTAQVVGQGILTLSRADGTTVRSNVDEVKLPCHPLHLANLSPIIPKRPPHTARIAMTPRAPSHSRGSYADVGRLWS